MKQTYPSSTSTNDNRLRAEPSVAMAAPIKATMANVKKIFCMKDTDGRREEGTDGRRAGREGKGRDVKGREGTGRDGLGPRTESTERGETEGRRDGAETWHDDEATEE